MERDEKRDYLVSIRESTGMTRKDFAIEYDIPYPTITDWELGHRRVPEYFLRLLAYQVGLRNNDCCFVSGKNWFRYRTGAIIIEDNKVLFATDDTIDYYYTVGGGVHLGESSEECIKREVFEETENIPKKADFGVKISGDSMQPRYQNGQTIWIEQTEEIKDGEIGIFLLDGNAYCKKLQNNKKGTFLISLNPKYDPIPITEYSMIKAFGRVLS